MIRSRMCDKGERKRDSRTDQMGIGRAAINLYGWTNVHLFRPVFSQSGVRVERKVVAGGGSNDLE